MKYKVGDKVRIKSLDWYNEHKDEEGNVACNYGFFFSKMAKFCSKTVTISRTYSRLRYYEIVEDDNYYWSDEMIEGLAEEEVDLIPKFGEYSDNESLDVPIMTTDFVKEHGLPCPEGYQFKDENGNVINAQKIVLEKKKKEYPKTYEECCEIFQYNKNLKVYPPFNADIPNYDALHLFDLLEVLRKLLICRDAYWKIAGEEMELGKPWKPDWESETELKYTIVVDANKICEGQTIQVNTILAFPTEEMRDAFKENFDPDIEICKELL